VSIEFLLGDFLTPFQGLTFDFLVSNPPYVSQKEWETLDTDVKAFEPKKALIAQEEGLFYYQNFAQHLSSYQNSSSKVFFEMGHEQKKEIEKIFFTSGYKKMQFLKDYQGKDRFFLLEIE
jgi:release factor glutamine methyltransferase